MESLIGLLGRECLYIYRHVTNEVERFRVGVGVLQQIKGARSAESGEIVEQELMVGVPNLGTYATLDARCIEYLGSMDTGEGVPRIGDVEGEQKTHRDTPVDTGGGEKGIEVPFPLDHVIQRAVGLAEQDGLPHSVSVEDVFGTEGLK
jgi:hypothetical protein